MQNDSGLEPMEYNVVIRMDDVTDKIGSLYIPQSAKEREELATDEGTLVAVSPHAFTYADWPTDARQPQPGDRVLFAQYSGRLWKRGETTFRILKDKDIVAVVEQPASLAAAA
jgi:co-chaperonin GroES (HSP10)